MFNRYIHNFTYRLNRHALTLVHPIFNTITMGSMTRIDKPLGFREARGMGTQISGRGP